MMICLALSGLGAEHRTLYPRQVVRRLYSSFAYGAPGLGLLLLRLAAGTGLIAAGILTFRGDLPIVLAMRYLLMIGTGVLLLIGLWTPIAGTLLALLGLWQAFHYPAHRWTCVLMGILGAALALLGPGGWSVDARVFGWKEIRIPDPRK